MCFCRHGELCVAAHRATGQPAHPEPERPVCPQLCVHIRLPACAAHMQSEHRGQILLDLAACSYPALPWNCTRGISGTLQSLLTDEAVCVSSACCRCVCHCCAATIAINPGGATKSYFDHTQDPISADVGSRRTYAKDVLEGRRFTSLHVCVTRNFFHLPACTAFAALEEGMHVGTKEICMQPPYRHQISCFPTA